MLDKFNIFEFLGLLLSVTSVIGFCFLCAFCGLVLDICRQLMKIYDPKERQKKKAKKLEKHFPGLTYV
jgi:hypothetical protein